MALLKRRRFIMIFILLNGLFLVGWQWVFRDNSWLRALDVNILHTIGILVAFSHFQRAAKRTGKRAKRFWHILAIGTITHFLGNIVWITQQIIQGRTVSSNSEFVLWLLAYIVYLTALVIRVRSTNTNKFKRVYFFNILIFMITIGSILSYYLIEPLLTYSNSSVIDTLLALSFPITNLSIVLFISILYYLVHKNKEQSIMLFLIAGFFLKVVADSYFSYLEINNSYSPGSGADYLWLISIWLIGFAGYYVKDSKEDANIVFTDRLNRNEAILPYISTFVLLILVINSYQWVFNALSYGALIIICMIILRQLFVINENNKLLEEFSYLAYHDPLTHLNNRVKFKETLDCQMKRAGDHIIALLLIDLDRFKIVNDTLGHQFGDDILVKIAERIEAVLESDMQVFRLGGDEFAVIIPQAEDYKSEAIAEAILKNLKKPFIINDHEITLTASIGVSMFPKNGASYEELFKYADAAMYLAKDNGKNGYKFYDDELSLVMTRRMRIESDLRKGLEDQQFELYYQSKVELISEKIIGMEALLRWNHPELGWISPVEFIPIAEETGQIVSIGEWVLKEACMQTKRWQNLGLPPIRVSVNVSVKQFQHGGLLAIVNRALYESGLQPEYLEIEVTESIMQDTKESTAILHKLRELGISISIDDFGTGYSSLTVIQHLPIDTIKLDKSFIDDIGNKNQLAMVKTILSLGENLGLNVVAEGIETSEQLMKLLESKCRIGQGYLFSKPVAADEFEQLLSGDSVFESTPSVSSLH
ncbi:MAG: EAL domain-containing protein [Alkalibacterium sp.]|nr:EAL domain-containing protein [Alkalibacterium sp.]